MQLTVQVDASSVDGVLEKGAAQVESMLADQRAEIAQMVRSSLQQAMESSGEGLWAPLAESTVRHRDDLRPGNPDGTLWQSLVTDDAPDSVDELLSDGSLRIGSDDAAGGYFSEGTRRQPGRAVLTDELVSHMLDATLAILHGWPDLS